MTICYLDGRLRSSIVYLHHRYLFYSFHGLICTSVSSANPTYAYKTSYVRFSQKERVIDVCVVDQRALKITTGYSHGCLPHIIIAVLLGRHLLAASWHLFNANFSFE
ncbi:uncharacterized protein F5891DRAFT_989063 [Suillus fuscotomentosus]|uniref:Uncharacterized protein n=1 Tax=Suillus fuscotomentosus TaxID=1912939 RepID=A0AAD4DQK7_9AGAM|nr:uncharacterized protein F5891DRAFT_989063 [Suillus fuscotomentosus]KAG1886367.1 hypothetical protein F5891DRAFT_989063 [Suillus fuscotomentosus]